jgi:ribosomal protein S18 acetylase RimI-like enzyme
MSTLSIRQAVLSDLDSVLPLFDAYRQFYGKPTDLQGARLFLQQRFEHGESVIFIAQEDGVALGFTQLYPSFSSVSMARSYVLNDLFVSEQGRRKGVGEGLLQAAAHYARSVGAVWMTLSTSTTNTAAQSLYESAGWVRDTQYFVYNLSTTASRG